MIDKREILRYEVSASWWARYCSLPFLQGWASTYFSWKVNRKYDRYYRSLLVARLLEGVNREHQ